MKASVRQSSRNVILKESSTVNVVKGRLWDAKSEFDEEKDKTQFRKYGEACEGVKTFYKEQHGKPVLFLLTEHFSILPVVEKQTVEFNIQARVNFRKTVRARMGK